MLVSIVVIKISCGVISFGQTFYRQCLFDNTPPTTTTVAASNITQPPPQPLTSAPNAGAIVRRAVNDSVPASSPLRSDGLPGGGAVGESGGMVCEQPLSFVSDSVLPALWRVIYWTSQVLTWLVSAAVDGFCHNDDDDYDDSNDDIIIIMMIT